MIRRIVTFWQRLRGSEQIMVAAAVGLVLFLLWASIARVDEISRGQGRVIPSSRVQIIQSAEPSTIREILVRSGQTVEKGQLLVRLDNTTSQSELGQLETENERLAQRAARLAGEGGSGAGCTGDSCGDEARLAEVRRSALQSQLAALSASVEQRRRDLGEAQATASALESSLRLAREQVAMLEPLAARGVVPQTELLTAQREVVDIQGRLAAARQAMSRSQAAIREASAEVSRARFDFQQEALNERSQLTTKMAVNEETIRGAEGRLARSEIRSPARGVVNDLLVNTLGGFVNAGEQIMQIVPLGDKLLIETRVTPRDIAFIKVGDPANVKVTAYDFSIYGGLKGKVVRVSPDSIYDEVEREAYFTVVVETTNSFLVSNGRRLPITPGMLCDVEILTGKKSVLSYLLKPVLKVSGTALTER
ncbi:HlyD family type I secretion periplasmic adaptor subunit [Sphingopyxis alaskensis]|jgi:adhesin transport system membrane fusion protein|uniref:Membrane fusion protein (MFP) family protein n=1 Tax=Sphingopyxis alaskensis (strain DSM 13593 / LMG 18877 / RB2256) TaxID=317655 RepID=Q1GPF8_SPHAL|nr:HlyD family type I secretion periplasmic adaptor subunit [Sphingopyxis alaskensis]ABF54464.1 Type I secretion membrane fusion protein, HlyD [Sphingopyxis alaskensis RB2256]MCM3417825.1 HlyD family type I secretion periplasmic adaptor subunit [Sphingopyxis alaskensis]